jgi:preprotein translocase subunit SecE
VPGKEAKQKSTSPARKASSSVRPVAGPVKKNFLDKSLQFLREVKVELKKVTWPSRKQTIGSTIVVIVLVMIISLFLGVIDIGLSKLVQLVLQ